MSFDQNLQHLYQNTPLLCKYCRIDDIVAGIPRGGACEAWWIHQSVSFVLWWYNGHSVLMENFVHDLCRGYWIYLYASFRTLNCFWGHQIFHILLTANQCTIIHFTIWKCHFLDIFADEYGKQKISIYLTKCRITWVHILDSSHIEQTLSISKSPDIFLYILCELEKA